MFPSRSEKDSRCDIDDGSEAPENNKSNKSRFYRKLSNIHSQKFIYHLFHLLYKYLHLTARFYKGAIHSPKV